MSQMLHTKINPRAIDPMVSEKIFKGLLLYMGMAAIWSCDPDAANMLSFPLPIENPHEIWL